MTPTDALYLAFRLLPYSIRTTTRTLPASLPSQASLQAPRKFLQVLISRSVVKSTNVSQVRQLAAVELRKRIIQNSGNLWTVLAQNEREEIKDRLPELSLAETK